MGMPKDRPRVKSFFDPSTEVVVRCDEPTMTEQHHKQSCDVNFILARYEKTGALPEMIKQDPSYGDFSTLGSYQESLHIVIDAEQRFAALDAPVRRRFGNDPAQFIEFALDPKNGAEMVRLGLAQVDEVLKAKASPPRQPDPASPGASSKA